MPGKWAFRPSRHVGESQDPEAVHHSCGLGPQGRKVATSKALSWPTARAGPRDCSVVQVTHCPPGVLAQHEGGEGTVRQLLEESVYTNDASRTPEHLVRSTHVGSGQLTRGVLRVRATVLLQRRKN